MGTDVLYTQIKSLNQVGTRPAT